MFRCVCGGGGGSWCEGLEHLDLYHHSASPHGVVLSELSAGTGRPTDDCVRACVRGTCGLEHVPFLQPNICMLPV
jgi:hypothetical protein